MLHKVGDKIFRRCDKCNDDFAHFTVQEPSKGQWFAPCDKCGNMMEVKQQ